jgi:hypothetical protein
MPINDIVSWQRWYWHRSFAFDERLRG